MSQRRAALADSNTCISGVDILTGTIGDMSQRGITECYRVKQQILLSATEAAEMVIRVDDIIKYVSRQREG